MDQIVAAACMVLSGVTRRIEEGAASDTLWELFLDPEISSSNFFAVADEGRDSIVSRAMAGHGATSHGKKNNKAIAAWEAFRVEQRGTSAGGCF